MAFNTPFKMWKRYEFNGGTADPCIISWPAGTKARGEIRDQYHHAIDIVPTILDVLGVDAARDHQRARAEPLRRGQHAGQPRRRLQPVTPQDPVLRHARVALDLARGMEGGHHSPAIAGWGHFNDDEWELYHTDVDRAETHNLAAEHPDKVRELVNIWFSEAGANQAFPLDDRSARRDHGHPPPQLTAPRNRYVYRPGTAPVPEWQAVNMRGRSYVIGALVDIPAPGAQGVLFAFGSRFGGHALYVKDNRLHYVNNFVGSVEQTIVGSEDIPTGHNLILAASFEKDEPRSRPHHRHPVPLPRRPQGRTKPRSRPNWAPSPSLAPASTSAATPANRSPTTTPESPPTPSPAAPSTASPSMSAASPSSTSNAKPPSYSCGSSDPNFKGQAF